jgi:predicted CoA-binding protein
MPIESDAGLRDLLENTRTIAVLGIKDAPGEDAHRVPAYLQARGYRVLPVNPKLAGQTVLGARAVASLAELAETPDLVDVFRAPRFVAAHADEILALAPRPKAVWLQLGIRDDASARRLEAAGIAVVQDRCIMVEHRRLVGSG